MRPFIATVLALTFATNVLADEKTFYYLYDHTGSVDVVMDEEGKVVERADYLPYGDDRLRVGEGEEHKYAGKELDDETELYYYGARYYDPTIAKFTTEDNWEGDLKDPQTLNKYSYALDNPIKNGDPTGNFVETLWDVGNVVWDIGATVKSGAEMVSSLWNGQKAEPEKLMQNFSDLGLDTASAMIPFVPAGVTKLYRVNPRKLVTGVVNEAKASSLASWMKDAKRFLGEPIKYLQSGKQKIVIQGAEQAKAAKIANVTVKAEKISPHGVWWNEEKKYFKTLIDGVKRLVK